MLARPDGPTVGGSRAVGRAARVLGRVRRGLRPHRRRKVIWINPAPGKSGHSITDPYQPETEKVQKSPCGPGGGSVGRMHVRTQGVWTTAPETDHCTRAVARWTSARAASRVSGTVGHGLHRSSPNRPRRQCSPNTPWAAAGLSETHRPMGVACPIGKKRAPAARQSTMESPPGRAVACPGESPYGAGLPVATDPKYILRKLCFTLTVRACDRSTSTSGSPTCPG